NRRRVVFAYRVIDPRRTGELHRHRAIGRWRPGRPDAETSCRRIRATDSFAACEAETAPVCRCNSWARRRATRIPDGRAKTPAVRQAADSGSERELWSALASRAA